MPVTVTAASIETDTAASTQTVNISTSAPFLYAIAGEGTSNALAGVTCSDSASQAWTPVTSVVAGPVSQIFSFYVANAASITSVTVNYGASVTFRTLIVLACTGPLVALPGDVAITSSSSGSSVTSLGSGSFSTVADYEIAIYTVGVVNGVMGAQTPGAGYTTPTNAASTYIASQYRLFSAIQSAVSTSMSWANSFPATGVLNTFKLFTPSDEDPFVQRYTQPDTLVTVF